MKAINKKRPWHTRQYLMSLLAYDALTGIFTRKQIRSKKKCGWIDKQGYLKIEIDGVSYQLHRLAWLFVKKRWPTGDLDHHDRNKQNNRIENLRLATILQNNANKTARKDSKTGIKGVYWHKASKRWGAECQRGKRKHLAYFDSLEEAAEFYRTKAVREFGAFAP